MAEVYGYFNGLEYDEKFPMMRVASLIPTGVYNDSLHVSAGTGLNVSVAAGKAWVNGYFYSSDASQQIATNIADAENSRKDVIVLRLDKVNRRMGVSYKAGTPSINPVPPALQRDSDVYELQLAEILFPAGSSSISAATITDTRSYADLCGITAGFQGLDVEGLTEQAQAKFDEWFANLKNQLSTDAAGNLQIQVDNKVSLDGYAALASGTDLNSVLSTGMYGGGWSGTSFINCPTAKKFKMKVSNVCDSTDGGHGIYVAQELTDTDGITYYRWYSFGTDWSSWNSAIPKTEKGIAGGIASLDSNSKVVQDPASKGQANGIAELGTDGLLASTQLYRSGAWSPALTNYTHNYTGTTTVVNARYILTGKHCHIEFVLQVVTVGVGNLMIYGLPFSPKSVSAGTFQQMGSGGYQGTSKKSGTLLASGTALIPHYGTGYMLSGADLESGDYIYGTIDYEIA